MTGQHLHGYDVDLCDYVLGNVVQHMNPSTAGTSAERCRQYVRLIGEILSDGLLLDHILKSSDQSADAERESLLFNDDELDTLGWATSSELDLYRLWEPYEALHRRYIQTVKEVRDNLSRQAADRWSDDCERFAGRLEGERVSLSEGVGIVREWVGRLRALLRAMGAAELLPAPEGQSPTPPILPPQHQRLGQIRATQACPRER